MWDYPRPPLVVPDRRTVEVAQAEGLVASTDQSVQLLETSHPPAFYLPPESVISGRLRELSNPSAGDIRIHTRNSPTTPHGSRSTQAGSAAPWMESLCDLKPVVSTGDGSPTTLSARSRVSPARLGGERSTTTETCREGANSATPVPETAPMTIKPRAVAWPTSTPMRPINDAGEDTVCGVSSREAATKVPLAAGLEYWSVTLSGLPAIWLWTWSGETSCPSAAGEL